MNEQAEADVARAKVVSSRWEPEREPKWAHHWCSRCWVHPTGTPSAGCVSHHERLALQSQQPTESQGMAFQGYTNGVAGEATEGAASEEARQLRAALADWRPSTQVAGC